MRFNIESVIESAKAKGFKPYWPKHAQNRAIPFFRMGRVHVWPVSDGKTWVRGLNIGKDLTRAHWSYFKTIEDAVNI